MSRYVTGIRLSISVPDPDGRRHGPIEHVDHDEDWWAEQITLAIEDVVKTLSPPPYVYVTVT